MQYAGKDEVFALQDDPPGIEPVTRLRPTSEDREEKAGGPAGDFLCFSHLRWGFVHQRPQHLMERFSRHHRLFYVEEPVEADVSEPGLAVYGTSCSIKLLVPQLPRGMRGAEAEAAQTAVLDEAFRDLGIRRPILWYYTPMSPQFADRLDAAVVVYDCMDELSGFRGAPPELVERERALMARADLVFTGGYSLWEAKRGRHANVHPFPSSVDIPHFATARRVAEAPDQASIPRPRLGFYGVIDERFDIGLLDAVAALRPDWQFVMLGPVVKIDPDSLPKRPNIHYPGMRGYGELPAWLAGWDVALMPFALNDSTRFISPTKTPEYLAAGRPVVSTPITDVIRHYGDSGVVRIADTPEAFVEACEWALAVDRGSPEWLAAIDRTLSDMSWDSTWSRMKGLIECVR
ncbi:glycosyltransferase family 1 protein [Azospirillum picis]|uniref:UDP-galactopyranose mutase n=1 Tax=Azospirillum picis TaxID=488438 RepID=A0ABU0MRR0_9PROT|nr:glycosyltransferase family 1 protein [Azospirillum picis]MBP2302420.1 UDP-galactopyranose mutase [Azospirillum picis]MDQ0535999.1 UDP-galactopyranose mutase [Azospirillum picis]